MQINITASKEPVDMSWLMSEAKRRKMLRGIQKTLEQLEELKKAVSSGTLRRSLMGFDQLNRLVAKSGGKSKESNLDKLTEFLTSPDSLQSFEKVAEKVDWLSQAMFNTAEHTKRVSQMFRDGAEKGEWMARGLNLVTQATADAKDAVLGLYTPLQGDIHQIYKMGQTAEEVAQGLKSAWGGLRVWFGGAVFAPIKADLEGLWDGMEPEAQQALDGVKNIFKDAGTQLSQTFTQAWGQVESAFSGGGAVFEGLTDGVLQGFRKMVNNLISGINKVVVKPFTGINDMFASLKSFSIGDLKPFKNLNFSIPMPQIPYLAKGAVLPANKPFMAVVGDQKHGTNIEAPLDVIRQAMAEVMAESVDAQLAGHSATVEVLKQILEAVLGISLDDGTVARAVERHQQRLAVMRGGF